MTSADLSGSPIETAAGVVGPDATRAFKLLGSETRLAILLALWEAYEPFSGDDAVAFSDLLERVDYDTSSNFSYHLEKLEGHFVESTEDGYRLRQAGHKIVRAVIAGAGITETTLEPTEIGAECYVCGAPLEITYEGEHLYTVCSECPGKFDPDGEKPPGTIMGFAFDPAGLSGRRPEELFAAAIFRAMQKFTMQMGGLCPECTGPVDARLAICDDHEPGGVCQKCGRRDRIQARWVCTVCKYAGHARPGGNLVLHPKVLAFYAERGLEVGYDDNDFEDIVEALTAMSDHEEEIVSTDPPRVRVTVRYAGDELRLIIDEAMNVVDVEG